MCSIKQIKELAERNAVYEFEKKAKMYGKEYIRYYYNKLAELNGSINSTCNCQHNCNSRDNEPCCRCDSKKTHGDILRNMSDEEMAERLTATAKCDECFVIKEHEPYCCSTLICKQKHLEWLQSEAE